MKQPFTWVIVYRYDPSYWEIETLDMLTMLHR